MFSDTFIIKSLFPVPFVFDNVSQEASLDAVHEVLDVTEMVVLELVAAGDHP